MHGPQKSNTHLREPRFVEEATVLAARPVVPLKNITEKTRARYIRSALAIVISVLVGVVATLILTVKERGIQSGQDVETKAQDLNHALRSESDTLSGESFDAKGAPTIASIETNDNQAITGLDKSRRPRLVRVRHEAKLSQTEAQDGQENLRSSNQNLTEGSARAADSEIGVLKSSTGEGTRERRVTGHKKRRNSADELLRITEIFEGVPHP